MNRSFQPSVIHVASFFAKANERNVRDRERTCKPVPWLSLTRHNVSTCRAGKRPATFVYCASCRCFQITEGEGNLLKLHNRTHQKERIGVVYRSFNMFCPELTPCSIILLDNFYSEVPYIPHFYRSQRFRHCFHKKFEPIISWIHFRSVTAALACSVRRLAN
jgi:hypothetical protein